MIQSPFFQQFLKLSNGFTLLAIIGLIAAIFIMIQLKKKNISFSTRTIIALLLGLVLGFIIDILGSSSSIYNSLARKEIEVWFSLFGKGFVRLIQLTAIPVVFLSIIQVVIDVKADSIKNLTKKTFVVLLSTTAISALVGIFVVKLFNLQGSSFIGNINPNSIKRIGEITQSSFPEFFLDLIPNNIFSVMSDNSSIVSVVIIAGLIATSLRFLNSKKPDAILPFLALLDSLRVTMNSVLINIIKLMPYAVIALVANTIISNGINAISGVIMFIVAIYVGILIMLVIYAVILLAIGLNPFTFYKKSYSTMIFAFSSRSSVGTLPYTLKTLTEELGVSNQSSNFVATLGTTIGMNGCAGVFPAMLGTLVGAALGLDTGLAFYVMVVVVVTIGSIGIAGVPGTATVAATVTLNGLGLGSAMSEIGSIFGIDPIIDMGRTALNVTGSMVSAIVVDRWEDTFDEDKYHS